MARIELHQAQAQIYRDLFVEKDHRYVVGVCSRGFGKSFLAGLAAITACQELMALPADVPNKNVSIVAPTHQQVVDIYHPLLAYQFGLDAIAEKHSAYSGQFWLPNNVMLKLWSYESVDRMRGTGQYFVVCDEVSSWELAPGLRETWESVIQPCITTRWSKQMADLIGAPSPGRALIISTPKGYNYLYDMYNFEHSNPDWKSYHFTYKDSPYLEDEEIEKAKLTIDAMKFAREYEASFEDSGATVFYNFHRERHVDDTIVNFQDGEDVHVCLDFNVAVMAWSAFAHRGNQMHFIEDGRGMPDTENLAKMLAAKYHGHRIYVYPDPTGKSRKTSAAVGKTDFTILESHGLIVRARRKSPGITDSVQAVNVMLLNGRGDTNMYFHPRCTHTIKSIERTLWKESNPDSAQIDKSGGEEHHSDGVRYATEYLHPVQSGNKRVIRNTARLF